MEGGGDTNLDSVDGIHDRVFLLLQSGSLSGEEDSEIQRSRLDARTAMPAKAPAAMFCSRLKFGGRDS